MKKLAVLLQIVGILAVCPMYVILEIKHSANEKSEVSSDSFRPKTEIMTTRNSNVPGNKSQNTPYPITK
jgi:hypothetical protein